ncbi:hypothetical protein [Kitasatospora sp. NPDC056181]|uniref:hypothetical protein n=1 Tax=Kitasatospora sp. NPDC056181 TaxID=3345737 RepID=UPI0035DA46E2
MTTTPRWLSEQHGPGGGSGGASLLRRLDSTGLDGLTLLVRESVQNSWDARSGDGPVDYRVELRTLRPSQAPVWRRLLEQDAPTPAHLPLRASLQRGAPRLLTVTDLGTKGLGGPTRADVVSNESSDFVAFVRNIGDSQDAESRGGTYGAGKVVFHLASAAHTVLVHTRCRVGGRLETRLIGWAIHEKYATRTVDGPKSFTGRHYWGEVRDGDGRGGLKYVEPLVGAEADAMAGQLGLHPFPEGATGTTVAVIDPVLGDRTSEAAMRWIADAMVWNLWPKMLPGPDGRPPLRLAVFHEGESVPVADPTTVPHLAPFVHAYRAMDKSVEHRGLKRTLGTFGLKPLINPKGDPSEVARQAGVLGRVHHTCLMRPVDLVVKYLEGPAPAEEAMGYAAVFRADPGMDRVFAASEPATHDDWLVEKLGGDDHRLANQALREVKREMREAATPRVRADEVGDGVSLAHMSQLMSGLMAGATGQGGAAVFTAPSRPGRTGLGAGAGGTRGGAGQGTEPATGRGRRASRLRYLGDARLDTFAGAPALIQRFQLLDPGAQDVRATLAVALGGGGREDTPPEGAAMPEIAGWLTDEGPLVTSQVLSVGGTDDRIWSLVVTPAPDTVTEMTVSAEGRDEVS